MKTFSLSKLTIMLVSICFIVISMWSFGNKQLGGFDISALVDTGWRMASGQTAYVDFPVTTPIAFYVGAGWAIQLFGAKWSSFIVIAIIFTVISFILQTYLLSLVLAWRHAFAISLVSQLLCSVVISYWWYNAITMNASCLFISAAYVFINRPTERVSAISLWGTLTLLSLMKPNIAGGLALLIFVVLFLFSSYRGKLILIGLLALISFFAILFLLKISPLNVIQSYLEIGKGRAAPTLKWFYNDKFYEHLVVVPLIVLCLLPMLERLSRLESIKHMSPTLGANFFVSVASLLTGCLSLLTNSDSNLIVGIPFFLIGSFSFYSLTDPELGEILPRKLWRTTALFFIIATLTGCIILQTNYHDIDTAPNMFEPWFIEAFLCNLLAIVLIIKDNSKNRFVTHQNWKRERIVWASLLVCGSIAMFAGGMRWRVAYTGYEMFFTFSPLTSVDNIPFFNHFQISPTAKTTLLEIQQALQDNYGKKENWKNASIFFGKRLEFAYATFGIASPLGLPIWWHPNNSYPADLEQEYGQAFVDHNFEYAIFMKIPGQDNPGFGLLPESVVTTLSSNYDRVNYSSIIVFHKKGNK